MVTIVSAHCVIYLFIYLLSSIITIIHSLVHHHF